MNRSRRSLLISSFVLACAAFPAICSAQDNPSFRTKEGDRNSSVGILSPQENDSRIARWLIIDEQVIIDCSKMAQERATNDNVKQFAKTIVSEHNSCLDRLESIRKSTGTSASSDNTSRPLVARTSDDTVVDSKKAGVLVKDPEGKHRDGKIVYHPTDFVKVKEEVCKDMKTAMTKEMKSINGSEFDRAYMMHMVAGHEALLATCKAVRPTASKEFQAMLDQDIEKLNTHTKMARQLCDQVCGKTSTGSLDSKNNTKKLR